MPSSSSSLSCPGLNVDIDSVGDPVVGAPCLVLVDQAARSLS